jgi:hypothetical protein
LLFLLSPLFATLERFSVPGCYLDPTETFP